MRACLLLLLLLVAGEVSGAGAVFSNGRRPSSFAFTRTQEGDVIYRYERAQTIEEARALGAKERDFEWRYESQTRGPVHCHGIAKGHDADRQGIPKRKHDGDGAPN